MLQDFQEEQRKKVTRVRSMMDFVMGGLIILIGLYFLLYDIFKINVFNRQPSVLDKIIGVVFILYGVWRIYRGTKKHYYR